MKIGIFTDVYHPDINGVVTSIKMLERELTKKGHEVYIFSPSKHEPAEDENLYMLKSIPLFVAKKFNYRIAAFYSREICKEIKEKQLDIVHTQSEFSLGIFGKIISRKFKIPFIHTYHTMWEDYMSYINPLMSQRGIYSKRFARLITKRFIKKSECVIAPSKKTEKYLKYKCNVINKPIYIVPTGIDIEPFNPKKFSNDDKAKLKESIGLKNSDKVMLYIGRIGEEKSIDKIINSFPEVLKSIPNTKFVLVGTGPAVDILKEQVIKMDLQDKVIFTGVVPWEQISSYYSIGDVFVNCSLTETQGLTFIEAFASGIPVVCKYAPNLAEFIHNNKNGILVKNNKDFAKNIVNVLINETLRKTLIENAFKTAKENSSKEFGEKLIEVYTTTLENFNKKKELSNKKEKQAFLTSNINKLKKSLAYISRIYKKSK